MKMLRKLHLPTLVAAVAAAGLSLTAAYAVPSYSPDPLSPTNAADGGANLGNGVNLINAQLGAGYSVVLPAVNAPVVLPATATVLPDKVTLLAAIKAAASAAVSDSDKADVLRSALFIAGNDLYKSLNPTTGASVAGPMAKDIVRAVLKDYVQNAGAGAYSQAGAIALVQSALSVNNGKDKDVMAGAILAVGDIGSDAARELDADEITAAAINKSNAQVVNTNSKAALLIAGLAETAIKSIKPGVGVSAAAGFAVGTVPARVNDMATAIVDAIESTNSKFLLEEAVTGIVKGAKALALPAAGGVVMLPVYQAISAAVDSNPASQAHAFAGAAKALLKTHPEYFSEAVTGFGGSAEIQAVSTAYQSIANSTDTLPVMVAAAPANGAFLAIGAVAASSIHVKDNLAAAITAATSGSVKIAMLEGVCRLDNKDAGKFAAAATAGGVSVNDAIIAALSNTTAVYAGSVVKEVAKANTGATISELVATPITTLIGLASNGAEDDPKAGIIDILGAVALIRKTTPELESIISTGIAALPNGSGYSEVIAAAIGRQDKSGNHVTALTNALTLRGASADEIASVLEADNTAKIAKGTLSAALANAQIRMRAVTPNEYAAVLIGAGAVDKKTVNVLLASALSKGNGVFTSGQKAQLLAHAKSLNKTAENETQLAYDVATEVLANPDELFDIADHESLKNPKLVGVVAAAAAAAAPNYAHYVARAVASRSTATTISKVPLAIFQGADMEANVADNPAATSAIAAGFVLGMKDAKHTAVTQTKVYESGMAALVKAAIVFGNKGTPQKGAVLATGSFLSVGIDSGLIGTANQPEYGSAAAVTGATSILSNTGDLVPSDALKAVLRGAGAAVGKGLHSQITVITQAAVQAFYFVTGAASATAINDIVTAIVTGAKTTATTPITNAAAAGKAEAMAGHYGPGAAGVLNYAHFNSNNSPVTDISGF